MSGGTEPTGRPEGPIATERVASLGVRAVSQLIVRAIATRAITLLGMIALARLLTPTEFGIFALVTVVVVVLSLIGDVGMGAALVQQARSPTEAEVATALTFQLTIWSLILGATWIVAAFLPALIPEAGAEAQQLARLLGVSAWLTGMRAVPTAMLTRVLRFAPLAIIEVVQQVIYFVVAVALAATGWGVLSFGVAAVSQGVVATTALWFAFGHWPRFGFDVLAARRMWGFGLSYQLSFALNRARDSVVALLGGLAGGVREIGLIQFAWRNGQFALSIEEIVARVAFPAFSRLQADPRRLASLAAAAIEAGFVAIALIQGWLTATAQTLVPLVFSDQWTPAILTFQLVCVGSIAGGPVLILRALVYARGHARQGLTLEAFNVAVLYVLFAILVAALSLPGAGIAFAIVAVVSLLTYVRATRAAVDFPWRSLGRVTVETLAASLTAALVIGAAPGPLGLLLSSLVYAAVFGALLLVLERDMLRRWRTISLTPA